MNPTREQRLADRQAFLLTLASFAECFEPPRTTASGETHRHQCPECETIWEHGDDCHGDEPAHRCPRQGCTGESLFKHRGSGPTTFLRESCLSDRPTVILLPPSAAARKDGW